MSPRVPEKERSAKQPGPWTSGGVPDPHILSGPLSGEETETPPGGGLEPSRVRRCRHALGRESFLGKTRPPTAFNTRDVKCAMPQQSPRGLLTGYTVDRALPRCTIRPLAPRTPVCYASRRDSSATEYHNAYAVDPTVYAATYTAPTGASPMGQVKTLSVRESTGR